MSIPVQTKWSSSTEVKPMASTASIASRRTLVPWRGGGGELVVVGQPVTHVTRPGGVCLERER
jgi:hypothetical protein